MEIKLTGQEDRELRLLVRRQRASPAEVVRARMILLLAKGTSFSQVAREVGRVPGARAQRSGARAQRSGARPCPSLPPSARATRTGGHGHGHRPPA